MTSIKTVVGFDVGSYFNYRDKTLKKGTGNQPTWYKYVNKEPTVIGYTGFIMPMPTYANMPVRGRMGIRTYQNGKWSA